MNQSHASAMAAAEVPDREDDLSDPTPKMPSCLSNLPPRTRALVRQHMRENAAGNDRYATASRQILELLNHCETLENEVIAAAEIIAGYQSYKRNIDEALNSGDGVYRP